MEDNPRLYRLFDDETDKKDEGDLFNLKINWIPTQERIMEDAIVMIGYYVL